MLRITRVAWLACLVVACSESVTVDGHNATTTRLIGPEGGTLMLGGGAKVVIPPAALNAKETISITKLDFAADNLAELPDRYEVAGTPFAFEPHGLSFAAPITIEVPFTGSASNVGAMRLPNETANEWRSIAVSDTTDGVLSIRTMTFSVIVAARDRVGPIDAGVDSGGTGGDSGSGGVGGSSGGGGSGGQTTTVCTGNAADHPNCINHECPQVAPVTGPRAMKGACCFRQSNAERAKLAWDNGETATIELRQQVMRTISQPTSLGNPLIQASLANTYEQEWSNTLIRIEGVPRTGSGPVVVTMGPGRSNCDGTYSFFGAGAALDYEGRTDGNRWVPYVTMGMWDWSTPQKLTLSNGTRDVRWWPVAKDNGLFGFEQPMQATTFDFAFEGESGDDVEAVALDCVGGNLVGSSMWNATLVQTAFAPVVALETSNLNSLALAQNQCSFMALGFMQPELCADVPRADWMELPFGMCDDHHCYVGQESHPRADCGAPAQPCCDPTGADSQMPACNAFVIESHAVLAGAEITDAPHLDPTEPFADCTAY